MNYNNNSTAQKTTVKRNKKQEKWQQKKCGPLIGEYLKEKGRYGLIQL